MSSRLTGANPHGHGRGVDGCGGETYFWGPTEGCSSFPRFFFLLFGRIRSMAQMRHCDLGGTSTFLIRTWQRHQKQDGERGKEE
ncbi:hypothetical protein FOB63_004510 [Clavispora lusitaniae]|uniref:uncharacterized protein n=1 Tax=Clavispora lusitaniae TaxID=36911 RepID=UPI00202C3346|nr:hypothetical protein FOB63_004510 [Clavispora lusitaniae]